MGHPFATFSRSEFLGAPKITKASNASDLKPSAIKSLARIESSDPFMGDKYSAKYCLSGCAVFDGEKVVASYDFGDTLTVDRAYRRQGIATELVYQWRMRYPAPAKARERTRASQIIQEKVWDRISREIESDRHVSGAPESETWRTWSENLYNEESAQAAIRRFERETDGSYAFRYDRSGEDQGGTSCFYVQALRLPKVSSSAPPLADESIFYHGTSAEFDRLDPKVTVDGGLHFGSFAQASARKAGAGQAGRVIAASLEFSNPQKSMDTGGNWAKKIKSAKAAGRDAIVYLNRYEGLTTEVIERLHASGLLAKLDSMTDAEFKKHVPEATTSVIVFEASQVRVVEIPPEIEVPSRPRMKG